MRYKSLIQQKLTNIESTRTTLQFQINRNDNRDRIEATLELLKDQLEDIANIISQEHDTFNQQF